MKTVKLVILLVLPAFAFAQSKVELASKIERVTVYYDGAQVTRTAKTPLSAGTTEITMKGITKFADVGNLTVKGEGDFTILKINPVPNYLREKESKSETEELVKKNKVLDAKWQDLSTEKAIYQTERSLITSNVAIKGNDAVLTVTQLKDMADFFRTRLTEIDNKILGIDREVNKINEEKNKNILQMNALANYKQDMTYDVIVTVTAKSATQANMILTYNTAKAGWFANYDVMVKNVSEPLSLNLRANVAQTSGEDWSNVKLTLSTGSPSINNSKPEITPWYLNFGTPVYNKPKAYNPNPTLSEARGRVLDSYTGEPIPFVVVNVKGTGIGTTTDLNGSFTLSLPQGSDMLVVKMLGYNQVELWPTNNMTINLQPNVQELESVTISESKSISNIESYMSTAPGVVYNGKKYKEKDKDEAGRNATAIVVAQPTTYVFEIAEPYTIVSNGKANTVGIKDYEMNAYYEYYCAPKLEKDAFLTARVTGFEALELIDGEANVYYENTYIGKTLLDLTNTEDTLSISLGRDKNVVVDLVKGKEYTQRQFLGSNRVDKREWEITVKNKKKQDINIVVQDRFPVSQNGEISVDNIDVAGSDFNKETGILTWRMKLAPNAEQKISPKYSVKYPKGKLIYLE